MAPRASAYPELITWGVEATTNCTYSKGSNPCPSKETSDLSGISPRAEVPRFTSTRDRTTSITGGGTVVVVVVSGTVVVVSGTVVVVVVVVVVSEEATTPKALIGRTK
jgi:hypothetical protein